MLVYCDSVVLIYLLDASGVNQQLAAKRIKEFEIAGDLIAVSDLCRFECRVKPIRDGDSATLNRFDNFFSAANVTAYPLTTAVVDLATEIRARHNFRTTDALHLASAVLAGCDLFLTNDRRLTRFTDLTVEVLA